MQARMEESFGLDKPLWQQYFIYMGNAVRLDLGPSFQYRDRNVTDLISDQLALFGAGWALQALMFAIAGRRPARHHRRPAPE